MKSKTFLQIVGASIISFFLIAFSAFASFDTSCENHGGINCSSGDYNGQAVCNDGTISNLDYYAVNVCGSGHPATCVNNGGTNCAAGDSNGKSTCNDGTISSQSYYSASGCWFPKQIGLCKIGICSKESDYTKMANAAQLSPDDSSVKIDQCRNDIDNFNQCQRTTYGYDPVTKLYAHTTEETNAEKNLREAKCRDSIGNNAILNYGECICKTGYQKYSTVCKTPTEWKKEMECVGTYGAGAEIKNNAECVCKQGYSRKDDKSPCISYTGQCQAWYGVHSKSTSNTGTLCTCETGYQMTEKQCVAIAPTTVQTTIVAPTPVQIPTSQPTAVVLPKVTTQKIPAVTPASKSKPQVKPVIPTSSPVVASTTETLKTVIPAQPTAVIKPKNFFQRVLDQLFGWL